MKKEELTMENAREFLNDAITRAERQRRPTKALYDALEKLDAHEKQTRNDTIRDLITSK